MNTTQDNSIDLNEEATEEFLADCRERLAAIDSDLLSMKADAENMNPEVVSRVCQALHSVRAGAILFDLVKIRELAHRIEDVLEPILSRQLIATPERVAVLLRATDMLYEMILKPASSNQSDISEIAAALGACGTKTDGASLVADRPEPRDGPLRSLLVEDDFASRLVLQSFLSRYGECHVAVNGKEAVGAFGAALSSGKGYDLICMDIMMPVMDGSDAVKHIRALEETRGIVSTCGVKVIMTTTVDEFKYVARCFRELCDGYMLKPIDLGRLLAEMRAHRLVP